MSVADNLPIYEGPQTGGGDPKTATSAMRIRGARRRIEAMRLRQEGLSYKEIGEQLGCSASRAFAIVKDEFARLRAEQNDVAENVLRLTNDRIERLMAINWPKALKGDKVATDTVLRLIDRQARLFGVDAPRKTQNTIEVIGADDPERLKAQARMQGLDISDLEEESGQAESGSPTRELPYRKADHQHSDADGRDSSAGRDSTGRDDEAG